MFVASRWRRRFASGWRKIIRDSLGCRPPFRERRRRHLHALLRRRNAWRARDGARQSTVALGRVAHVVVCFSRQNGCHTARHRARARRRRNRRGHRPTLRRPASHLGAAHPCVHRIESLVRELRPQDDRRFRAARRSRARRPG